MQNQYLAWFETLGMKDVPTVGGKNASLGEMIQHLSHAGVKVPGGFATTALAFTDFMQINKIEQRIRQALQNLDINDVHTLAETGAQIRQWVMDASLQPLLEQEITTAYQTMHQRAGVDIAVAVRSSATAEDLPDASFAGQQETYLNVHGIDDVLSAVKQVFASLYNDRAIAYRVHKGFAHSDVALSAGIQRMVRSDIATSGVLFTLDTESGFRDVVLITASYGLGEMVVQGAVNPDEFYVHKPMLALGKRAVISRTLGSKAIKMVYADAQTFGRSTRTEQVSDAERQRFCLTDAEIEELARQAVLIEKHYGRPMDIEWGKDGEDSSLYILQARPETVKAAQSKTLRQIGRAHV